MSEYTAPAPQLLTPQQVAERLQVSDRKVYYMIDDKELPAVRFGKNVRVRPQDLEAFINSKLTNA